LIGAGPGTMECFYNYNIETRGNLYSMKYSVIKTKFVISRN